jgi:ribonuclease D
MRDDVLVEIARRRPQRESDLAVLRGFPQARNRKLVHELIELIAEASKTPPAQWPQPPERHDESPMGAAVLDLLSAITQAVCHEQRLSRHLLGGTSRLRELLDYHVGRTSGLPEMLRGWRGEFIGRRLLEVVEGRSEIHLSGWPDNPRLTVVSHAPTERALSPDPPSFRR